MTCCSVLLQFEKPEACGGRFASAKDDLVRQESLLWHPTPRFVPEFCDLFNEPFLIPAFKMESTCLVNWWVDHRSPEDILLHSYQHCSNLHLSSLIALVRVLALEFTEHNESCSCWTTTAPWNVRLVWNCFCSSHEFRVSCEPKNRLFGAGMPCFGHYHSALLSILAFLLVTLSNSTSELRSLTIRLDWIDNKGLWAVGSARDNFDTLQIRPWLASHTSVSNLKMLPSKGVRTKKMRLPKEAVLFVYPAAHAGKSQFIFRSYSVH